MNILVTGGAGFIGSHFVTHILNQGHRAINIDKLTYAGNVNNLEEYHTHPNHLFFCEDICNRSNLEQIVYETKPDWILHAAAESHVDRSIDCADDFIQTNIFGTYSILEVGFKYYSQLKNKEDFKFIHLSTDEVFGSIDAGKFNEQSSYKPNSPYAASKASSDLLVRSYQKTFGFPAIIVNASNNYGPKQYPEKLIPLIVLNALELKPLPIYGNGTQVRDWLFVEDHARALYSIFEHGKIGESYCISAENEITNLQLVKKICNILLELMPLEKPYIDLITFVKDRPGHDLRYATDAKKLREHTDWRPQQNFDSSLCRTVEWYVKNQHILCNNHNARQRIGLK